MALVACRECHTKVSDRALICPKCGCSKPQDEQTLCSECGTALAISHRGPCPNCGNPGVFEIQPPAKGYKFLYSVSLLVGISIAIFVNVYGLLLDHFSESLLVQVTPVWVFPIVFGYYGFVAERMATKLPKTQFENVADLLFELIKESSGTLGKVFSLLIHAPFIIIKSKSPLLVALGGSIIWAIILVIFFTSIFPRL